MSRLAFDCVHRRLDLVRALSVLDFVPEGGRDRLLELLHQVLVALAERSLDRLEVVDVRVADGLLGGFEVSRASLGDGASQAAS